MMKKYFDFNATTPMLPEASAAWQDASTKHWHNPSGLYGAAAAAHQVLEDARDGIADWLGGTPPERVLFNAGATEANNAVFRYIAEATTGPVLVSVVEHPCVIEVARAYLKERLVLLSVDASGVVGLEEVERRLGEERCALVSVMAANNECGVIQPWQTLATLCDEHGVPFHCDAAQWLGKLPAAGLAECAYVTGSAHKFGGPKGTGFLLVPGGELGLAFRSLLGGPQQEGRRAGTENLPGIVGMLAAGEALETRLPVAATARALFEEALLEALPDATIVGREAERLWNTVMVVMPHSDNRRWLSRLDARGFAVSTGSACSSGKDHPSRVLEAMGYGYESMGRVLRVSAGWDTTLEDWEALLVAILDVERELRQGGHSEKRKITLG